MKILCDRTSSLRQEVPDLTVDVNQHATSHVYIFQTCAERRPSVSQCAFGTLVIHAKHRALSVHVLYVD